MRLPYLDHIVVEMLRVSIDQVDFLRVHVVDLLLVHVICHILVVGLVNVALLSDGRGVQKALERKGGMVSRLHFAPRRGEGSPRSFTASSDAPSTQRLEWAGARAEAPAAASSGECPQAGFLNGSQVPTPHPSGPARAATPAPAARGRLRANGALRESQGNSPAGRVRSPGLGETASPTRPPKRPRRQGSSLRKESPGNLSRPLRLLGNPCARASAWGASRRADAEP